MVRRNSPLLETFRRRPAQNFRIDFRGDKIQIRSLPVYNDDGAYLGVLEVDQVIG